MENTSGLGFLFRVEGVVDPSPGGSGSEFSRFDQEFCETRRMVVAKLVDVLVECAESFFERGEHLSLLGLLGDFLSKRFDGLLHIDGEHFWPWLSTPR
jgi:hypothetical protein